MNGATKVFVGLSGGVDSATVAALLKEQGYDVTGIFVRIWQPEFIECTWREDRLDAMRVCAQLEIPFVDIDLSKEYEEHVLKFALQEYRSGRTPNPDVLCNQSIKFGFLLEYVLSQGARYLATGHYARVEKDGDTYRLLRGKDPQKDQSYFLSRLNQAQLSHTLMPLGTITKEETRAKAKTLGLSVASKPDSQGLCFIGDIDMKDFLKRFIDVVPGDVKNTQGTVVGRHHGAALYTIGERHGFELINTSEQSPQYIVGIDIERNELTISNDVSAGKTRTLVLESVCWVAGAPPKNNVVLAQVRYRQTPVEGTVIIRGTQIVVNLSAPLLCARGQECALYAGDELIGSGVIA